MAAVIIKKCLDCKTDLNEGNWKESDAKKRFYVCQDCYNIRRNIYVAAQKIAYPEKFIKTGPRESEVAKEKIVNAYGTGVCVCCGEVDLKFLTLDHIFNNGKQDRAEKNKVGFGLYRYLINNNFPDKNQYQILCWNCNCAKGLHGICPHEKERKIKEFKEKSANWFKSALSEK